MARGRLYAGLDVGTSRVKLVVYDEGFKAVSSYSLAAPLRLRPLEAEHDPWRLREAIATLLSKAEKLGVRAVGVSVYRGSVAAWLPGGEPATSVILWADYSKHSQAFRSLPLHTRLLARAPLLGRLFEPGSPLPLAVALSREAPAGARVWTVDALVAEWLSGKYVSEPVNAGTMGLLEPFRGRRLGVYRLVGVRGPQPGLALHDEPLARRGSMMVGPVIADQQASLIASGCMVDDCVKVDAGSGFFADIAARGIHAALKGLVPLVALKTRSTHMACLEAMAPGVGLALEAYLRDMGLWPPRLSWRECLDARPPPAMAYMPSPRSGAWHPPAILGAGLRGAACSVAAGAALALAHVAWLAASASGNWRARVFGGAARLSAVVDAAAAASGVAMEVYGGVEASSLGAALLAAYAAGDVTLWDVVRGLSGSSPSRVARGGRPSRSMMEAWAEVLGGRLEALPELSREFWDLVGSMS